MEIAASNIVRSVAGTQRALLEAEGVAFRLDGTVDLEQCLWTPES